MESSTNIEKSSNIPKKRVHYLNEKKRSAKN